jgi:hypothetical protein
MKSPSKLWVLFLACGLFFQQACYAEDWRKLKSEDLPAKFISLTSQDGAVVLSLGHSMEVGRLTINIPKSKFVRVSYLPPLLNEGVLMTGTRIRLDGLICSNAVDGDQQCSIVLAKQNWDNKGKREDEMCILSRKDANSIFPCPSEISLE